MQGPNPSEGRPPSTATEPPEGTDTENLQLLLEQLQGQADELDKERRKGEALEKQLRAAGNPYMATAGQHKWWVRRPAGRSVGYCGPLVAVAISVAATLLQVFANPRPAQSVVHDDSTGPDSRSNTKGPAVAAAAAAAAAAATVFAVVVARGSLATTFNVLLSLLILVSFLGLGP